MELSTPRTPHPGRRLWPPRDPGEAQSPRRRRRARVGRAGPSGARGHSASSPALGPFCLPRGHLPPPRWTNSGGRGEGRPRAAKRARSGGAEPVEETPRGDERAQPFRPRGRPSPPAPLGASARARHQPHGPPRQRGPAAASAARNEQRAKPGGRKGERAGVQRAARAGAWNTRLGPRGAFLTARPHTPPRPWPARDPRVRAAGVAPRTTPRRSGLVPGGLRRHGGPAESERGAARAGAHLKAPRWP